MLKQNTNHNETGYVLKVVTYREHDAMVDFFGSQSGLIRLILPGLYKPGSKQTSLGFEFSKVNYRFAPKKNGLSRIIGGERVDLFTTRRTDMDWLLSVSIVGELVRRYAVPELNHFYFKVLEEGIHEHTSVFSVLSVIRDILKATGLKPHVESCVICGSTGINAFSIEHGGFLCNNHTGVKDNKRFLYAMKSLFEGVDLAVHITSEEAHELMVRLLEYVEYHDDIWLNSFKIYKELGKK